MYPSETLSTLMHLYCTTIAQINLLGHLIYEPKEPAVPLGHRLVEYVAVVVVPVVLQQLLDVRHHRLPLPGGGDSGRGRGAASTEAASR